MRCNKIFSPQNLVVFLIVLVILIVGCTPKIKRTYDLPTNNLSTLELYDSNVWVNGQYMGMIDSIGIDSLIQMYFKSKDSVNLIVQPESKYSHVVQLINNCKKSGIHNIELFNAGEHLLSLDYSVQLPDTTCNIVTFVDDSSWSVGVTKSSDFASDSFYTLPPIHLINAEDDFGQNRLYLKDTVTNKPAEGAFFKGRGEFFCRDHGVDIVKIDDLHVDSMYWGIMLRMLDKGCDFYYIMQEGKDLLHWAANDDTILVSKPIEAKYQLLQHHFYSVGSMGEFEGKKQVTFLGRDELLFSSFESLSRVVKAMKIKNICFGIADYAISGVDVAILREKYIEDNKKLEEQKKRAELLEAKRKGSSYYEGIRSKANITETFFKNKVKIYDIYRSSFMRNKALFGKLNIWFHIENSGKVVHAEVDSRNLSVTDTIFTNQILTEVKTWDFGAINEVDTTIITIPIVFR